MLEEVSTTDHSTENQNTEQTRKVFPFYRYGAKIGMLAGFFMATYLFLIRIFEAGGSVELDFLKYIILAIFLGIGLYRYKKYLPKGKVFRNGLLFGIYTVSVAALTLIVLIPATYLLGMDWAGQMSKFSIEVDSIGDLLLVDGVVFFEALVYGLIITFIWLQWLKTDVQDPEPQA